ncbi:putative MYND domain protein [Staphylotrichum tortipilum]|uniref:MYND domain protein n=1 Tax=Staphylotrichum tortipilum TaxID=2831512 RepID=A0AAN6RR71_9PEZI|nr:putative MYND domain protein [Staphylotrichum longicolle]
MADATTTPSPDVTCIRCRRPATTPTTCTPCQTPYCSTDCLKADKKKHQKRCRRRANGEEPPPDHAHRDRSHQPSSGNPLDAPHPTPFTLLEKGSYLHPPLPRTDVFRLLIDCYRLRVEDDFTFEGRPRPADPRAGFAEFLGLAEQRKGLLPEWWDRDAKEECRALGEGAGAGWFSLEKRAGKKEVNEMYRTPDMAMQLRILGEGVYGRGPAGQPGGMVCAMMARQEREGGVSTILGI